MEFFSSLPDEKILEICEKMDNISLGKFIQTSERIYNVCNEILIKKKEQWKSGRYDRIINKIKSKTFASKGDVVWINSVENGKVNAELISNWDMKIKTNRLDFDEIYIRSLNLAGSERNLRKFFQLQGFTPDEIEHLL